MVRILNFDNSVTSQKNLIGRFRPEILDLTRLESASRMWLDGNSACHIKGALGPALKNAVTFLGSGDFHHISSLLIGQFDEDISVVIFDFHPDLDNLPPKFSCGSWVNLVAGQKNVKKIVIFGPSSRDLDFPNNATFNLSYIKDGRLELYPYYHKPSFTLSGKIIWENLRGKDMGAFVKSVIEKIPSKKVYISVDKDCLARDYAVTNWEPGMFSLDDLLAALKAVKENAEIIGADITGDYSPVNVKSVVKKIAAAWDHPPQWAKKMPPAEISRINEGTNLRILEILTP